MNRRRAILLLLALSACAAAVLAWQFLGGGPARRLVAENFPQVRTGMSQAEVEQLLGGPPGNYGRYPHGASMMTLEGYLSPAGAVEKVWCDDTCRFEIYFDAEGRVVGQHRRASYSQQPPEGILAWLRRVVGL